MITPASILLGILCLGIALTLWVTRRTRRRHLPVIQQRCDTCAHWDRSEGQRVMEKFPAFRGAAEVLTPAEMAYGYELDENGERVALKGPKDAALFAWDDFGACRVQAELRHKTDSCTNHAPREDA